MCPFFTVVIVIVVTSAKDSNHSSYTRESGIGVVAIILFVVLLFLIMGA